MYNEKLVFDDAIEFILSMEGGYVNDPDDPGGETKYGISKRQYPDLDIKSLTKEKAKEIYYYDYWKKSHIDKIALISPKVAIIVLDTHINTYKGIKILQKTIYEYGKKPFINITIDNIYGKQTHTMLTELYSQDKNYVIYNYLLNRELYYIHISDKNRKLLKYIIGWSNRVKKLKEYVHNINENKYKVEGA